MDPTINADDWYPKCARKLAGLFILESGIGFGSVSLLFSLPFSFSFQPKILGVSGGLSEYDATQEVMNETQALLSTDGKRKRGPGPLPFFLSITVLFQLCGATVARSVLVPHILLGRFGDCGVALGHFNERNGSSFRLFTTATVNTFEDQKRHS